MPKCGGEQKLWSMYKTTHRMRVHSTSAFRCDYVKAFEGKCNAKLIYSPMTELKIAPQHVHKTAFSLYFPSVFGKSKVDLPSFSIFAVRHHRRRYE
uniref:FLYWCH-type domain-containing protein n=1 Tax=Parascaris equorum TaxID=6256 RepID=A0A914S7C4_PAREQ